VAGAPVKPAPFDYRAPESLDEALALLDEDSRPLAGGQSLVPLLNFRLARPERLVDLNGVRELDYLDRPDGVLRIGAMTRQAALERSMPVAERWPLLTQAIRFVGHPQIRNRGTVGGSVAHADPAAELPAAMLALDARMHARSMSGTRTIDARDFFVGPLTTVLEQDELLTEVEVPAPPPRARAAFVEEARTHGDFATAGAAVLLAPGEHAAVALLGGGPAPMRAPEAERALVAGTGAGEAAELAAGGIEHPYRRALVTALVRRAIEAAGG
jgi:CO/xanthine dehydrogenase FAD-binding subunit